MGWRAHTRDRPFRIPADGCIWLLQDIARRRDTCQSILDSPLPAMFPRLAADVPDGLYGT